MVAAVAGLAPAYFVAAGGLGKSWLLGPYPDRPTAEAQLPRVPALAPGLAGVRVATAPAGVRITTLFGA